MNDNLKNIFLAILLVLFVFVLYLCRVQDQAAQATQASLRMQNEQLQDSLDEISGNVSSVENENTQLQNYISNLTTDGEIENESMNDSDGKKEEQDLKDESISTTKMTIRIPVISSNGFYEIMYIDRDVLKKPAVLDAVYRELFTADNLPGRNFIPGSGLNFDSVSINNAVARVNLSGNFIFQETGDFGFRKQINAAALQYDTVDIVEVYLNNQRFDWCVADQSGGENGCPDTPMYWIDSE